MKVRWEGVGWEACGSCGGKVRGGEACGGMACGGKVCGGEACEAPFACLESEDGDGDRLHCGLVVNRELESHSHHHEKAEDEKVDQATRVVQLGAKELPLVQEELIDEPLHELVEEQRGAARVRINARDELHDVAVAIARRVDAREVNAMHGHRTPNPQHTALLAQHELDEIVISELGREL